LLDETFNSFFKEIRIIYVINENIKTYISPIFFIFQIVLLKSNITLKLSRLNYLIIYHLIIYLLSSKFKIKSYFEIKSLI